MNGIQQLAPAFFIKDKVFFENDGNQEIAGTFYSRPKLQSDGETWKVQIYKNWEELCADVDLTGIGENDRRSFG